MNTWYNLTHNQRCNGERPFCATCQAVGKAGDCEYEEGQSYTAALLEKTKVLEERLATIENEPVAISTESIQQGEWIVASIHAYTQSSGDLH